MNTQENQTPERIEGLGDEDTDWGDYPIDTLLRNEQRTLHDVVRRIKQGSFVVDPDFQRAFIWDEEKQRKLIESVLRRIPLPVFYLAQIAPVETVIDPPSATARRLARLRPAPPARPPDATAAAPVDPALPLSWMNSSSTTRTRRCSTCPPDLKKPDS